MDIHVVDGTYELFRHFFAVPSSTDSAGNEIGAVRGVVGSILSMIEAGATHVGVATDHVIESFRNDLYAGYKTSEGVDRALLSQFLPLEDALEALGVVIWPMVEQEADDAMAAAAVRAAGDARVDRILICTPDKDLAQCVIGDRVVQLDRRKQLIRDETGVWRRFGVAPKSIPDFLGLVGDTADGFPGLPGWGAKSAATVLARYAHLEDVPQRLEDWEVSVRGGAALVHTLREQWEDALLFRDLATLRTDAPVFESIDELDWKGPRPEFESLCASMNAVGLWQRAMRAAR